MVLSLAMLALLLDNSLGVLEPPASVLTTKTDDSNMNRSTTAFLHVYTCINIWMHDNMLCVSKHRMIVN